MRKALLCWIHQFIFFWYFAPSTGWYVKMQIHFLVKTVWMYQMQSHFQNLFFQHFWLFYAFLVTITACTCILSDFPGIKNLYGLNDPNSISNLSSLNDLYSLFHQKTFNLKKNIYFERFAVFYYLKKVPKSRNNSKFIKEQEILTN